MHPTRHQFRESLRELEQQTLGGLDLVIAQLDRSLDAVVHQDVEMAAMIVALDDRIDGRYLEIHRSIVLMLALQAPVATDLRVAAALMHIIGCIERMGDQCVNIAKLVSLSGYESPKDQEILDAIARMGHLARMQACQAKQAFATRQVSLAADLAGQEAALRRLNRQILGRAVEVGDERELREWAMFMILAARALERIGGNTLDIAAQTAFVVTGLLRDASAPQPA
jgi:phosphate transport system protein